MPAGVRPWIVRVAALLVAALFVGAGSACSGGGKHAALFKHGTYEYNLTAKEKDALRALFPAREAAQLDGVDRIAARLEFSDDGWVQTWMLDGKTWSFDDARLFQRDHFGEFRVDGDRLALYVEELDATLTYTWSLDGDVLSLALHESPADPAAIRELVFATQHAFTRLHE